MTDLLILAAVMAGACLAAAVLSWLADLLGWQPHE